MSESLKLENLLTPAEVSEVLRVKETTLRTWRHLGSGPDYVKINANMVRYRPEDVRAWIDRAVVAGGPVNE